MDDKTGTLTDAKFVIDQIISIGNDREKLEIILFRNNVIVFLINVIPILAMPALYHQNLLVMRYGSVSSSYILHSMQDNIKMMLYITMAVYRSVITMSFTSGAS